MLEHLLLSTLIRIVTHAKVNTFFKMIHCDEWVSVKQNRKAYFANKEIRPRIPHENTAGHNELKSCEESAPNPYNTMFWVNTQF